MIWGGGGGEREGEMTSLLAPVWTNKITFRGGRWEEIALNIYIYQFEGKMEEGGEMEERGEGGDGGKRQLINQTNHM